MDNKETNDLKKLEKILSVNYDDTDIKSDPTSKIDITDRIRLIENTIGYINLIYKKDGKVPPDNMPETIHKANDEQLLAINMTILDLLTKQLMIFKNDWQD